VLCGGIRFHRDYTRISIMSFDREVHFHVSLNKYYSGNPNALANFIRNKIK